jgi:8-oxo-dGTP diphosphatase
MSIGRFYAGIGALLWYPADGTYLVLKRSAEKDFAAEVWECVTGRVDQGEDFTQAVHREVREELGVAVQIELLGVQFCCSIEDPDAITLSAEHSEYCWVTAAAAAELFPQGHWLARTIQRAEAIRALSPPELLAYHRREGWEL